jgi:hypothetical protein
MPYKDPEKRKEAKRKHYLANKEKYAASCVRRRTKYKEWFFELRSTLKCERCPEDHPAVLDFHHRNDDKVGSVAEMVSARKPKKEILAEIEKCIVLCSNCHRKLHWKIFNI